MKFIVTFAFILSCLGFLFPRQINCYLEESSIKMKLTTRGENLHGINITINPVTRSVQYTQNIKTTYLARFCVDKPLPKNYKKRSVNADQIV